MRLKNHTPSVDRINVFFFFCFLESLQMKRMIISIIYDLMNSRFIVVLSVATHAARLLVLIYSVA